MERSNSESEVGKICKLPVPLYSHDVRGWMRKDKLTEHVKKTEDRRVLPIYHIAPAKDAILAA